MRATSTIPEELLCGPFLAARAYELELSRQMLRGSRFRRVFQEVYASTALPHTAELVYDAALLRLDGTAIASHDLATRLLGLPTARVAGPVEPHFWLPDDSTGTSLAGARLHWYARRPPTVCVHGRTATGPAWTFLDMATRLSLFDLVALGDAAVRRWPATLDRLDELVDEPGRRGIRLARRAAPLLRRRVDSVPETHLRLLLHFAGLPAPDVGRTAYDSCGGWLAVPDLSYPEYKIAIEYDGAHHGEDKKQWSRDVLRNSNLSDEGWKVIVVLAHHLYRRPALTVQRVLQALRERGHPGAPASASDAWRAYFG